MDKQTYKLLKALYASSALSLEDIVKNYFGQDRAAALYSINFLCNSGFIFRQLAEHLPNIWDPLPDAKYLYSVLPAGRAYVEKRRANILRWLVAAVAVPLAVALLSWLLS